MTSNLSICAFNTSKIIKLNLVLLLIFTAALLLQSNAQQNIYNDSLLICLANAETDSAKLYYLSYFANNEVKERSENNKYLQEGLALSRKSKLPLDEGEFLIKNGEYSYNVGDYSNALKYLYGAIEIGETYEKPLLIIRGNYDIGLIYYYWKNFNKAYEYMNKAYNISQESGKTEYKKIILNGIGSTLSELGDNEKAKKYILLYKIECEKNGRQNELFIAYNNLGLIYKKLDNLDSSIYYTRKGLEIAKAKKDTSSLINIYSTLINYYTYSDNLDSSKQYVYATLNTLKPNHPITWKIKSYQNLFLHYQKANNSDSALIFINLHYSLKDSLYNKEQLNKMNELQTHFETKRYQDKIDFLEQQNKMQALQLYGSIAGFLSIFLILLLSYRSYKLKLNLQKQDKQLADEKSTVMKERIEFQKRESATNALYIVKQNRLYDGLLKDLKKLGKTSDEDRESNLKSIILDIQKGKKTTEKKDFEIKFKRSHQNFYKSMKEQFSDLTKRELDLCAYLMLNMSTKEIASLSNTSVRAIEVSRSRLRKKLEVKSGVNLSEFIRSIKNINSDI